MSAVTLRVRVVAKVGEATDICSYELVDENGGTLPPFTAGSHIDVHVGEGLIRQYSLCNDPRETHRYLIGVLRDPNSRGGSVAMHDRVQVGDVITISAPRNHFLLDDRARRSLLLAGGIGVTPILSMAEQLHAQGQAFEMHYAARSADRMAFRQRLAASAFAKQVHCHFDDGAAGQKLYLAGLLGRPAPDTHLYVCGPSGFLKAVLDTARAQGWPDHCLHSEVFSATVEMVAGDRAFDVKIASTGRVYRIAADKPITVALAEQGVDIPVSCEQGVCGTCLTRVIDGEPDHRDMFMTDAEHAANDQFTPCCSRARGAMLVLDL